MSQDDFTPSPHAYIHRFAVRPNDIDELGHANNVVWVRWVNEAAFAHAAHVGMGPAACMALSLVWVVRRHDIAYLLPAFEGETLEATTWAHTLKGATSTRRTVFVRDGKLLARAETTWALLDTKTGRPTRVPAAVLAAYGFEP
jgi:acyl-CoA thioester hydrolase